MCAHTDNISLFEFLMAVLSRQLTASKRRGVTRMSIVSASSVCHVKVIWLGSDMTRSVLGKGE